MYLGGSEIRSLVLLIPSLLFLSVYGATIGQRDLPMARLQAQANTVSARMNSLSANVSQLVQRAASEGSGGEAVQTSIDEANQEMSKLQLELEAVWSRMDNLEIRAARDAIFGRALRAAGILSAVLALLAIGWREPEHAKYCMLACSFILGFAVVQ